MSPSAMDNLRQYLVELPRQLHFKSRKEVHVNVFKALYYAVIGEGDYMDTLFPDAPYDKIDELQGYQWSPYDKSTEQFYEYTEPVLHFHPPGSICARKIEKFEKCYVCMDCGYDETCIMCSHCFFPATHIGHNVTSYTSGGGGLCDCGDKTAFVRDILCSTQYKKDDIGSLPPGFTDGLRDVISTVLTYILDVANFSVNTLPLIHKNINGRGDLSTNSSLLSNLSSLPTDTYGVEDVNSDDIWHLVLWNDENHNYPEAETSIRAATGAGDRKAKNIANEINAHGRAILKTAKNYEDLLKPQKAAEVDGLVATICTARDYMREMIMFEMVKWLSEIVTFEGNIMFRLEAKKILAELLLEPDHQFSKVLPGEFLKSSTIDIKQKCFTNGILYYGELLTRGPSRLRPDVDSRSISDSVDDFFYAEPSAVLTKSKIQYLLAFEIRFIAEMRKLFTSAILPVLFSDAGHKQRFCEQYAEIFSTLSAILAYSDREEKLVSMTTVTLQLFTCPLTNQWILTSGNLPNFVYPLNVLIQSQAARPNETGIPNLNDVVVDIRSRREKSSIHMTIQYMIEALHHIISKNDEKDLLNYILEENNLYHILLFQRFFQGICPVTRKYGDHVGTESLGALQSFLNKSAPILNIVKYCCKVQNIDKPKAIQALKKIAAFLYTRQIKFQENGAAEFRVSKDPVSLINPVNSFFSFVLQEVGMDSAEQFIMGLPQPFLHVSDFSLRSIVLASQIRIGAWIRNGLIVSQQLSCYTEEAMEETSYHRDFHLNQIEVLRDDPEQVMTNFLDRWELMSWYQNEVEYENTVYEHRFHFICERFIIFLYNLLTDRTFFDTSDSATKLKQRCRVAICYSLCEKPKAYTELKNSVPSFASELAEFDEILRECATYQPPTGVYDTGMYRLKSSLYDELDPLSQMDANESQSIFEELITAIAKNRNVDAKTIILQPKITTVTNNLVNEKLGAIFRTKLFAKLVYKLLQIAIDTKDEAFLPHLLHLLHAAIVDNEIVRDNSLQKSFVTIPICNLLLTISESSSSPSTAVKADFLLDKFIAKDGAVMDSLIDCFGETHIEQYREKKEDLSASKRQKSLKKATDRKAKIMRKFEKQREKFMKQNDMTEVAPDEVSRTEDDPTRHCVACGEAEDFDEPFGILVAISKSPAFWKVPQESEYYPRMSFLGYDYKVSESDLKVIPRSFPPEYVHSHIVGSTCAHGIHMKCHSMGQFSNYLPCPLCHSMHDVVLTSYQTTSHESAVDSSLFYDERKQSEGFYGSVKNLDLLQGLVHIGYFDKTGELKSQYLENLVPKLTSKTNNLSSSDKVVHSLNKLSRLIANTIRANEAAFRLDGSSSVAGLFEQIPSSLRFMVLSFVQARVLLYHTKRDEISQNKEEVEEVFDKTTNYSSYFDEVVNNFFSSERSLQELIKHGMIRVLAASFIDLMTRLKNELQCSSDVRDVPPSSLNGLDRMCRDFEEFREDTIVITPEVLGTLYAFLEKCLLSFMRQCAIFVDILFGERSGENEFRSHRMFRDYKDLAEQQTREYSPNALAKCLGVPTFDDLLQSPLMVNYYIKGGSELPRELSQIDYPNAPRLYRLPEDFASTVVTGSNDVVDSLCLTCGENVSIDERLTHHEDCVPNSLFFSPERNSIVAAVRINDNRYLLKLPGPYMTVHGEVKQNRSSGPATLNEMRYTHLNKMWLNQNLYGFATRNVYGPALNPALRPAAEELFEDSEEDDLGFWE